MHRVLARYTTPAHCPDRVRAARQPTTPAPRASPPPAPAPPSHRHLHGTDQAPIHSRWLDQRVRTSRLKTKSTLVTEFWHPTRFSERDFASGRGQFLSALPRSTNNGPEHTAYLCRALHRPGSQVGIRDQNRIVRNSLEEDDASGDSPCMAMRWFAAADGTVP
jgi:hypothetical protein